MTGRPGHKSGHRAVRIDEAIGRAKASTDNVVGTQLWEHVADIAALHKANVLQSHLHLLSVVCAQIRHLTPVRRAEQIALRPVITGEAQTLFEAGVKRNRVERHLDADESRKLSSHSAHAFAGGSLALGRFALDDEDIAASVRREVIGDTGADDSPSDDDDIRSVHESD